MEKGKESSIKINNYLRDEVMCEQTEVHVFLNLIDVMFHFYHRFRMYRYNVSCNCMRLISTKMSHGTCCTLESKSVV